MASSAYEIQMAKLDEQMGKHKDKLVQMHLSDNLCGKTEYPTQLLSSLASDPFIGLLPQEDIRIIINSLLWFYGIKDCDPTLQNKARSWSSLQFQSMTRMPIDFLNKHTYLCSTTIPQCLTKAVSDIERNMDVIIKQGVPSNLINLLCRIGLMTVKQKCLPINTVESIFRIFRKSKRGDFISKEPLASELFNILSDSIQQGNVHLSPAAKEFLLSYHKRSIKVEVITLLAHAGAVHSVSDIPIIESSVKNSQLPLVSSTKREVFQYALSIMTSAWLNSEGHPGFGFLIAHFVALTEKFCKDQPLASLFPENVQHLAFLFSLSPFEFPSHESAVNVRKIIDTALRGLELGVCTSNDLSTLMVIFPAVYHQFLLAAAQENDSAVLGLLRILWKSNKSSDEELIAIARRYCHNIWLCQNLDL